jgi:hypothetical protein
MMSVASRAKPLRSLYGLGFTVTTGPPGGWAVSVRPLALRAAVAGGSLWAGVRAGQLHRPLMFPASRRLLGEPGLLIDICSRCPETTHRTEAWFWTVPTEGPQGKIPANSSGGAVLCVAEGYPEGSARVALHPATDRGELRCRRLGQFFAAEVQSTAGDGIRVHSPQGCHPDRRGRRMALTLPLPPVNALEANYAHLSP